MPRSSFKVQKTADHPLASELQAVLRRDGAMPMAEKLAVLAATLGSVAAQHAKPGREESLLNRVVEAVSFNFRAQAAMDRGTPGHV